MAMVERRQEQVRLRLPLAAGVIMVAVEAFMRQFHVPHCYLYVQGHVVIEEGSQLCEIMGWASVVGPEKELDLLILEDADAEDEVAWRWVNPTSGSLLLLSTHPLAEERYSLKKC
ncbi:hypothetical protein [Ktedonobacter racemifer]|uniref:Uncharacterized protein n=1 Tax=Ktedonobacter racemifer DSM 44963 TaxID=485913 RepID=D6U2Z9_KTERA|nr:hypothetical protein [Ktedonobacter racemifer]EFH82904.1 hypothetical protein Krac_3786 [Ktedonobacter racemifer DSM 44963]